MFVGFFSVAQTSLGKKNKNKKITIKVIKKKKGCFVSDLWQTTSNLNYVWETLQNHHHHLLHHAGSMELLTLFQLIDLFSQPAVSLLGSVSLHSSTLLFQQQQAAINNQQPHTCQHHTDRQADRQTDRHHLQLLTREFNIQPWLPHGSKTNGAKRSVSIRLRAMSLFPKC